MERPSKYIVCAPAQHAMPKEQPPAKGCGCHVQVKLKVKLKSQSQGFCFCNCLSPLGFKYGQKIQKKNIKKANSNDMRLSNVSAINREDRQKQADRTGTAKDVGDVAKAAGLDPTYV